jgi:hypothetical protein
MKLPRNSLSDTMCNAALKAALEPFMDASVEFDLTSGPRPGITWRAIDDDLTVVLQLRTEGRGMSYLRIYDKGDQVVVSGFSEGEGWAEMYVAGGKLRSSLADPEVKAWISDLESKARQSLGEDFVMSQGAPKP